MQITELPFNRFIGIQQSEKDDGWLTLPGDIRYTNHLGTVHASALLALAEATSGEFLLREIGSIGFEVIPVVRKLESKFRKPAQGSIHSKVNIDRSEVDQFVLTLKEKGRAIVTIKVDVFDENEVHALTASVEWFVTKNNPILEG